MTETPENARSLLARIVFPHPAFFTPRGFLVRACELSAVFGLLHLLGIRRCTSILCGTIGQGPVESAFAPILGLLYVILYLAFVVVVPVLVLAAIIMWTAQHAGGRCHRLSQDCHPSVAGEGQR